MSKDLYFDNVDFSEIHVTDEIDFNSSSYEEEEDEEEDGGEYINNEVTDELDFNSLTF